VAVAVAILAGALVGSVVGVCEHAAEAWRSGADLFDEDDR